MANDFASDDARRADLREARRLMRLARSAALGTRDGPSGDPYVSLVTVATDADASPLILISGLARHSHNLAASPRASLLFDAGRDLADPLAGARVTVSGEIVPAEEPDARRRFLARHPEAEAYADFGDFSFRRLRVETAHFIAGFGRILNWSGSELLLTDSQALALGRAEPDIIAHMNADHADAVELFAVQLLGAESGPWRLAGCDAEGCDLRLDSRWLRLDFPRPAETPGEIRTVMVELVVRAREKRSAPPPP